MTSIIVDKYAYILLETILGRIYTIAIKQGNNMARTKGAKNKIAVHTPDICSLTPEQRIELLANLIIDRIIEDQAADQKLLRSIGGSRESQPTAS